MGRFGWKAGKANIVEQSAAAFSGDIGISSPVFPAPAGDCTAAQVACQSVLHGDGDVRTFEVDNVGLDLTVFYTANLAVPSRGDVDDPEVLRGKAMFYQSGCVSCHTPKHVTARLDDEKFTSQSFQLIWPYSDLLLHDMGPELSDNRPEGRATAQEWRTPPLWGIGLTGVVSNNQASYLHDGRARTLLEAILWHGGEGATARDAVVNMQTADREYLIKFLESL